MVVVFVIILILAAFGIGVIFSAAVRAAVSDVEARLKALEAKAEKEVKLIENKI